ncbi:hypothetical protein MPL3365_290088 [Mesorhizobium plurifarium]|uniref:Uncharacterized protein n=1 Tax=Mesorhizobium plurifarium TaxID=69974 RepID=A0A090GDF7_MESPL|nr:hypothetical protein MPL3365_290088 [Mesorhizobium plurifarium]
MACLLDRIGEARPPRSQPNGDTKTRGNIAGQIKPLWRLCQGLRRRRCEPLGSDGTAGRLPRHADVEVVSSYFMTTSRLQRNAADGKPCSIFLELLAGHPSLRF